MPAKPSYAVIGAGIGGLALAGFLARNGVKVRVYEQAKEFQRIGAGIQMSPNAVRVLRALGLEPGLRKLAFYPPAWSHRVWDTGEHLADLDVRRRGGGALRCALPADAPRRPACGAVLGRAGGADCTREEAPRASTAMALASRCSFADGTSADGRRRDRRRRRALAACARSCSGRRSRSSPAASRTARPSRRR